MSSLKKVGDTQDRIAQIDAAARSVRTAGSNAPCAELLMHIVMIDDSKSTLSWMKCQLEQLPDITITTFEDPTCGLEECLATQFDLVMVDYTMPKLTGIDVTQRLRAHPNYRTVPIVMVTSDRDRGVRLDAFRAGATDFLNKPADEIELQLRISNLLSLRRAQVQLATQASDLTDAVERATREIVVREEEMIWQLARAIEMRDGGTGEHISRVAAISRLMAVGLGLDDAKCRMIYLAAPLHDVGKIGVSDTILGKPGKLTDTEMAAMREHVTLGVQILERGSSDLMRIATLIAGGHHERWDGKGYPNGLSADAVPIEARIVAVADVFDALCSRRPYKPAWPLQRAFNEILAGSGSQFDPDCVEVFRRMWPAIAEIAARLGDGDNSDDIHSGRLGNGAI